MSNAFALLILRIPLGLYFAIAGWNKIRGVGLTNFVEGAKGDLPTFMPESLGRAYLYALPGVELVVGLMLLLGIFTRVQATLIGLMLLSFLIAKGEGVKIVGLTGGGMPMDKNVVFLSIAIAVAMLGGGRWSMERLLEKRKPQSA